MVKSMWKGSIRFGIVSIPIKMYAAIEKSKTMMKEFHATDNGEVGRKSYCKSCGDEVKRDAVIKGVLVQRQIVTVSKEEVKAIRPEKSSWIEVVEFVPSHIIESFYFNTHYFLGAEQAKDKTFFLFRDALRQCGRTAVAKFVMREKEYVCAIQAYGSGLLLTTLNYNEEIREISQIPNLEVEPEISEEEMKFARMIIDQASVDDLDMSKFNDTFKAEFQTLLETKAGGKSFTVEHVEQVPQATNLLDMLKASVSA